MVSWNDSPEKTLIQLSAVKSGKTMFGVKWVNLLCALLNTSTSHWRHKIPLSNSQRPWGTYCLWDYARLVLLKSRSLCLWCKQASSRSAEKEKKAGRARQDGWINIWMEAPHARGGGRGGVVVALTCGETRSGPRRPPPASHRPSLSLLCAFLQRVNNYPCDKHGSCAPDDEKHARRSLPSLSLALPRQMRRKNWAGMPHSLLICFNLWCAHSSALAPRRRAHFVNGLAERFGKSGDAFQIQPQATSVDRGSLQ